MPIAVQFQDIISTLQRFWADQGCLVLQPYDTEKGAGTMSPHTVLRAIGPEPWAVAYAEPCRRPDGGGLDEQICRLLLDHYGCSAKPVLLLRRNGNHWLGMLDYCPESRERQHRISHLHRCLNAS